MTAILQGIEIMAKTISSVSTAIIKAVVDSYDGSNMIYLVSVFFVTALIAGIKKVLSR